MADGTANPTYSCRVCLNPVALRDDILSKTFAAKSGKAYLFSHAMNVVVGRKVEKQLITGRFTVADICCSKCGEVLGWKYVRAYEPSEKYKEGKFILEIKKMVKDYY